MKRTLSLKKSPEMGSNSNHNKLRIAVLLAAAIQVVMSSQSSTLLPIRRYTIHSDRRRKTIQQRNHDCLSRIQHQQQQDDHHHKSLRIRGGGISNARPSIAAEVESFFRDRVIPRAQMAHETFRQKMDAHRERKEMERREQLKRNQLWRETAEQTSSSSSSSTSKRNRLGNNGYASVSSYAGSSALLESSRALNSSSWKQTTLKTVLLPTRLLKLSLVVVLLAEILDRTGVFEGDTPEIVWSRIEDFWRLDVLRVYTKLRCKVEGWYYAHVKRWVMELQLLGANLERKGQNLVWRTMANHSSNSSVSGSQIWSTTIKATFALSAACGMIASPLLVSWVGKLWWPILTLAVVSEANHYFKRRGGKFVGFLEERPQTLGAAIDGLLERCRNVIQKMATAGSQTEDCYYEGYGSGSTSNRGSVDDRYGDATVIGLMGGDVPLGASRRNLESRMRLDGFGVDKNDYSLGISPYYDLDEIELWEMEAYNRKRRTMAKQGLVVGCAIGLAMKGEK